MTRSSVDLPQPEGPMRDTSSPRAISRSIPLSATVRAPSRAANTLPTPVSRTIGPAVPVTSAPGSGRAARRPSDDGPVGDVQRLVDDLEALRELRLGDAQRRVGVDRVV